MEYVIEINNLSKSYDQKIAVKDLTINVPKGKAFGLLGANGAGKTTTVECILGTKNYDSGNVKILNMDPKKNRKELFNYVGVEFQENAYQREISVKDLCEETSCLYSNKLNYLDLCETFGLTGLLKRLVKDLSGGERQKLFIVLALIPNPKVLVLDELTTGLDAKARRMVWNHLKKLKEEGITIFLTSHFMDEIEVLCDEICILKKGNISFRGTVKEAIEKSNTTKFEDAYLFFSEDNLDENIF